MADEFDPAQPNPLAGGDDALPASVTNALQASSASTTPSNQAASNFENADDSQTWNQFRQNRINGHLQNSDVADSLQQHHAALADAQAASQLAREQLALWHEAHSEHDTAGFLNTVHGLDPKSDTFESDMAGAAAKYPFARGVHELLQPLHYARSMYLNAKVAGGQYGYSGDAQQAFQDTYKATNDPLKAHAAAIGTQHQIDTLHTLIGRGADRDQTLAFKPDGSIDYDKSIDNGFNQLGAAARGKVQTSVDKFQLAGANQVLKQADSDRKWAKDPANAADIARAKEIRASSMGQSTDVATPKSVDQFFTK